MRTIHAAPKETTASILMMGERVKEKQQSD